MTELKTRQISRDYHPIPQEKSNPDQMAAPLVLPAQLDKIKFDQGDSRQCTYIDCRGRMRTELMKVVGTNFWQDAVVGDALIYRRSSVNEPQSSTNGSRNENGSGRFNTGNVKRSLGAGAKRARQVIVEAYIASECVAAMASMYCTRYTKAWKTAEEQRRHGGDVKAEETTSLPVPCPSNLIWTCAYTPNGISINDDYVVPLESLPSDEDKGGHTQRATATTDKDHPGSAGYWAAEAALCHYNMFVLFLQLTFLQMHTERPLEYLPGDANAAKRKALEKLSSANGCLAHLNRIREYWSPMRFGDLARVGLIPDRAFFDGVFNDLVQLLRLDYCIFHTMMPIHSDNGQSMYDKVMRDLLLPQMVVSSATQQAKSLQWAKEVLSMVALAANKAHQLYSLVFAGSTYSGSSATTHRGERFYKRRLTLNNAYSAFVVKYVAQAMNIFKFIYRAMRVKIVYASGPGAANFPPEVRLQIFQQLVSLYELDPEFSLCMDALMESSIVAKHPHYRGTEEEGDDVDELYRNYPFGAGPTMEMKERDAILHSVPQGKRYERIGALESEIKRLNVAIPGEIYRCDFAFNVWDMESFAQFPLSIISSLRSALAHCQRMEVQLEDAIRKQSHDHELALEAAREVTQADPGDSGIILPPSRALDATIVRAQAKEALKDPHLDQLIRERELWFEKQFVAVEGASLCYKPSRACREFIEALERVSTDGK